jgi:hypothetical protein
MSDKKRRALMEEAAHYRERAARGVDLGAAGQWACDRGHHWDDSLDVASNVRCMNCASQRREAEARRLHDIARVRGGLLASSGPIEASMSLDWQCAHGHVWSANAHEAQRCWCGECARTVYGQYR